MRSGPAAEPTELRNPFSAGMSMEPRGAGEVIVGSGAIREIVEGKGCGLVVDAEPGASAIGLE